MTKVGHKEPISIVPQTIAILSNVIQPFVKESPIELITRLRLHKDSIGLFKANIHPPLSHERSPMNALAVLGSQRLRIRCAMLLLSWWLIGIEWDAAFGKQVN